MELELETISYCKVQTAQELNLRGLKITMTKTTMQKLVLIRKRK